jgi:signal peptide peptidase SppA
MTPDFTLPHSFGGIVPRIDEYFGVWAMHEPTFRAIVDRCNGIHLTTHVHSEHAREAVASQTGIEYPVTKDGIAVIAIRGPMMKQVSSMSGGTSTVRIRQQLRAALNDPEVAGAMLVLDTPGGTVSGNADLAREVQRFAEAKPIYAYTEDLTASAGVSVASMATKRFANNASALYGSMGVYSVLTDSSQMAEKVGVKVHVIRAGEHKGAGTPGTEITPEQLAEAQRIIDQLNAQYLGLIAEGLGRSLDSVQVLADGRIHSAQDAVGMGLLDGIQPYDATMAQLVAESGARRTFAKRGNAMTENGPTPATLAELKQSFPRSTAEWRESQLEAGATLTRATGAWAQQLEKQLEGERAAREKAEAAAVQRAAEAALPVRGSVLTGNLPLTLKPGEQAAVGGDPVQAFAQAMRGPDGRMLSWEDRKAARRSLTPQQLAAHMAATNDTTDPAVRSALELKAHQLAKLTR